VTEAIARRERRIHLIRGYLSRLVNMGSVTCVTGYVEPGNVRGKTGFVSTSQEMVMERTEPEVETALQTQLRRVGAAPHMTNFTVTEELRAQLKAISTPISRGKGAVLFQQGDAPLGIYLIEQGKVALHLDCGRRTFPTRVVGRGCIIGLPGTLSGTGYSLTAETVEECKLEFVAREQLLAFLRDNPGQCFQLVELLSQEISELRAAAQRKRNLAIA